jgi:hypothetical protein
MEEKIASIEEEMKRLVMGRNQSDVKVNKYSLKKL